jgi:FMN phosphatase YigB (HAD superfamily)
VTIHALGRDIHLISFDLDDTLVDTFGSVPARVRAALQSMHPRITLTAEAIELIALDIAGGNPERRNVRLLESVALSGDDPVALELLEAFAANDALIGLIEGAHEVLQALHGQATLAIVTNGVTAIQNRKVTRHHHRRDGRWLCIGLRPHADPYVSLDVLPEPDATIDRLTELLPPFGLDLRRTTTI